MKAIQTRYNGYLFRSRLEARWAVFFKSLGMKWEYEPEGFDLGDGVWYLPDFRVKYPRGAVWFEVKGDVAQITPHEWQKIGRFAQRNQKLWILDGAPEVHAYMWAYHLWVPSVMAGNDDEKITPITLAKAQPREREMREFSAPRYGHFLWDDVSGGMTMNSRCHVDEYKDYPDPRYSQDDRHFVSLRRAVEAARSHRFGEGGRA